MRKRHILLITCILISMLLISCQTNNPAPTPSPTPEETSTPAPTPSVAPSPSATPDALSYETTESVYTEGDIIIHYPQITGLGDAAKQEQINVLIQADAIAIAEEGGSVDVAYTVTWAGPHLLSIQYSGLRTVEGAAYPNNLFYTTNVDIASGTKLSLADMITIDASFVETFKAGQFVPWNPDYADAEDMIRETVAGYDLNQAFTDADNGYGPENPDYCFSYFTEDSLGISLGVPHAIGDHAEFEIKYADIEDNIKTNELWDDFDATPVGAAVDFVTALYGDWTIINHASSNPRGSTYSAQDIEAMMGKQLTYAEKWASFDGTVLDHPYYQESTETNDKFKADSYLSFEDLGISADTVTSVKVCTDPEFEQVWLIPASFIFIKDQDRLIIMGDGEYFEAARQ